MRRLQNLLRDARGPHALIHQERLLLRPDAAIAGLEPARREHALERTKILE